MPNLPSAKKRLRQAAERELRNRIVKTRIKTETKKALGGLENEAVSMLDRAAAKGVIHKNAAARRKSRLAKRLAIGPAKAAVKSSSVKPGAGKARSVKAAAARK